METFIFLTLCLLSMIGLLYCWYLLLKGIQSDTQRLEAKIDEVIAENKKLKDDKGNSK